MSESVLHKNHNPPLPIFRGNALGLRGIALGFFHTSILCEIYLSDYKRYQHEIFIGR